MVLDYVGKIIFLLIIIIFISGLVLAIKQVSSGKSKPSTILGLFNLLCLSIIILLFLIFDINKLHIIWILVLVYLLSFTKYAFSIGIILFNLLFFILKKTKVSNNICPKCNNEIYKKSDSIFRFLFIGEAGVRAFPKYYCVNCGKLKFKDLPVELRKKAFRWRIIYVIPVVAFIVYSIFILLKS